MDTTQLEVLIGGSVLSAFVLWFFLGPRASERAEAIAGGIQQIGVTVKGGYSPDRIEVRQGQPVRLLFKREESNPCTEQLVMSDFGVSEMLPQGQEVPIEFTPDHSGEFDFHCGMNMVHGKLIVKASGDQ